MAVRAEVLSGASPAPDETSISQPEELGFVVVAAPRRRGRRLSWIPLTAVAAMFVLMALPIAGLALGYRTFVVTGGSMAPTADAGDAILLEEVEANEVRPGDLITYRPLRSDGYITHRVLSVHDVRGRAHFRTRGDANGGPDADLVPATNVLGRVTLRVPGIGMAYAFATSVPGRLLLVAVPALLIVWRELRSFFGRTGGNGGAVVPLRRPRRRPKRATTVAAAVLLSLSVAGPAAGVFTETPALGSNTFVTGKVEPPILNSANADLLLCKITLSWAAPGTGHAPDGYDVYRSTTNGGPYSFVKHVGTVTTTDDTGLSRNTTYYYVLRSSLRNWRSVNSNQRSATTALLCI